MHLFAVAVGPKHLDGHGHQLHVIMVSVTSVKPESPHDPACIINAGEHPFITHESYVYYREPRIEPVAHVQSMVANSVWRSHEPCSPELLARIRSGLLSSRRVPRHIKKLLEQESS